MGKDDKGGSGHGVVVKKFSWGIFSFLMFGKEAVCPDCLFVPAVFQEPGFYLNSLIWCMNNWNYMFRSDSIYEYLILDDQRIGSRFPTYRSDFTWFVFINIGST